MQLLQIKVEFGKINLTLRMQKLVIRSDYQLAHERYNYLIQYKVLNYAHTRHG